MELEMKAGNVRNAERVVDSQKSEPWVLGVGGALLLAICGFFVWRELHLENEVLAVAAAAGAAAIAVFSARKGLTLVGPLCLLTVTGVAGVWYAGSKEPVLLAALSVVFVAAVAQAIWGLGKERLETAGDRLHRMLSWNAVGISGLVASFAIYFQIFDADPSENLQAFVARRAVLTLTWLLSGVALVLVGRARRANELRDAGFVVLAASVAKLLFYDTTHLDGMLRIGALAVGGVALLTASQLSRRFGNGSAQS